MKNLNKVLLILLLVGVLVTPTKLPKADDPNFALQFDGVDDHVDLGLMTTIFGSDAWRSTKSIVLWINPAEPGTLCVNPDPPSCKLILGTKDTRWFGITQGLVAGQDRIWVWNKDEGEMGSIGVPYTPGEWIQIAVVHANGLLTVYKDGTLNSTVSTGATSVGPGQNPKFFLGSFVQGAPPTATYLSFNGIIDEVRVYSSALTQANILQNRTNEIPDPQNEPGLVAYYKMSDGVGITLTDNSANGNTGSLYNGVQWVPSLIFDQELEPVVYRINLPLIRK